MAARPARTMRLDVETAGWACARRICRQAEGSIHAAATDWEVLVHTRVVLGAGGITMATAGLLLQFTPLESLARLGIEARDTLVPQLFGGLLIGFAMLNWMSRGVRIGGIYARPLAVGNFAHFFIGTVSLLSNQAAMRGPAGATVTLVYAMFALAFGYILFTRPSEPARQP
jgi:hypothetical protein